jgi:hypothetical protein
MKKINKKSLLCLYFLLCLFFGFTGVSRLEAKNESPATVSISNELVKLTVSPEFSGKIVSLEYLPLKKEVMFFDKGKQTTRHPLLPPVKNCVGGYNEFIWGKPLGSSPFRLVEKSTHRVRLITNDYLSTYFAVKKTYSLRTNDTCVYISTRYLNKGSKSYKLTLWLHLIAQISSGKDFLYVPICAASGENGLGAKQELRLANDAVISNNHLRDSNNFFTPAQSWIGRLSRKDKLAVVLENSSRDLQDTAYYIWQGKINNRKIRTIEMILKSVMLSPGSEYLQRTKILIISGLETLSCICDNLAVSCRILKQEKTFCELNMDFAVSSNFSPSIMTLGLVSCADNKAVYPDLIKFNVPELHVGKVFKTVVKIPLKALPKGKYTIVGSLSKSGESIKLLSPIVEVK